MKKYIILSTVNFTKFLNNTVFWLIDEIHYLAVNNCDHEIVTRKFKDSFIGDEHYIEQCRWCKIYYPTETTDE